MGSNSTDLRRLMSLVESVQEPTIVEGWVSNLRDRRIKRLGEKERREMAGRLHSEYKKWLGQTDRQGTMEDMRRFMVARIGFTDDDISAVMDSRGISGDHDDEEAPGEEQQSSRPSETPQRPSDDAYDDEEGLPIPRDLDTPIASYAQYGLGVERDDGHRDASEVTDDPRRYRDSSGEWDFKKIRAKLDRMEIGDKLVLGRSTFYRKTGQPTRFYGDGSANESIMEAGSSRVLDTKTVKAILNACAARVNDAYLLDGPRNDQADAVSDMPAGRSGRSYDRAAPVGSNQGGTKPSGQYDTQEMLDVLQSVNYPKTRLPSLINKVKKSDSVSKMSDQDMNELALVGYAFLRARS